MDAYLSRAPRKRPRNSPSPKPRPFSGTSGGNDDAEEDSTDLKLAMISSLFPDTDQNDLLDILIASDGSVETACQTLRESSRLQKKRAITADPSLVIQRSLSSYTNPTGTTPSTTTGSKSLTKRGKTLHLFSPEDIAAYTPCTIIHNFLPKPEADTLLRELLTEATTFERQTFQLFDTVVQSPHSAGFYVSSAEEQRQQKSEYTYNGNYRTDVRQITSGMRQVSVKVQEAVNKEIQKRILHHNPEGKKLKFQSPREWVPNAAFVNCYDGPAESVGYHSDELTYLGPQCVIGSLSLGVAREFRVRRIVPRDEDDRDDKGDDGKEENRDRKNSSTRADAQGQISIHLPHNSLLVMHAGTQEEWKHSIAPAQTISPHPISGNKRINVTYRWYRESLHPRNTPKCRCKMPAVLRCVQRKKETRGQYMWMCYAGYSPGKQSCSFFEWANFDDDGEPIWSGKKT
ncbi:hypothetical protein FQN54_000151 [Arachnomyces sp. PD_36]|nr:hypothetical protein FQN54_000151 [Arachnomyces sp. PD_36]